MHGMGVVEGGDGANGTGGRAPGGDVAVTPAVLALGVPVGGVRVFNSLRSGKESNRGALRRHVPWVYGNSDRGSSLALPGCCVRVEIFGGEDAYVLGVKD